MSADDDAVTLALTPRRAMLFVELLDCGVPLPEALETVVTVPDRALWHFVGYRYPTADRPGRPQRRARFKAGRR